MRVVVILASIFFGLLLLAALIIGVFWWYKGGDLAQAVESGTAAGIDYGRVHDDLACRDQALELMGQCDGMVCGVHNQAFISACLTQAERGALCDEIPRDLGFAAGLTWVSEQCQSLAQEDSECAGVMQVVMEHCSR